MNTPARPKKLKPSRRILKPIEGFVKEIRIWQETLRVERIAKNAPRNTPMPELTDEAARILQEMTAQGVGKAP